MRGVIPFNDEHFMLIGYSAKGGVNVELKVDFDKAGHGSIPARESAITILTKGNFHNLRCNTKPLCHRKCDRLTITGA